MKVKLMFDNVVEFEKEIVVNQPMPTPIPAPIPIPVPPTPPIPPTPIPEDAQLLSWGLTNYIVSGSPGLKKTFIINVQPGKTYGSVSVCSLDPTTSFTFKFTPVPGYLYLGRSEYTGSIYYGMIPLDFSPSYFTPQTTDGYIPPGDNILEINFTYNGRILISNSIY